MKISGAGVCNFEPITKKQNALGEKIPLLQRCPSSCQQSTIRKANVAAVLEPVFRGRQNNCMILFTFPRHLETLLEFGNFVCGATVAITETSLGVL